MHRCLVSPEQLLSDGFSLHHEESRHLKTVLRIKPGDLVELFDGKGRTRCAQIDQIGRSSITVTVCKEAAEHAGPPCCITLFACISKGKRMDWTVEKAVELGASRIIPVISERTIVRLTPAEGEDKAERWRRVAAEAARQCGTAWIPEIAAPLPFSACLSIFSECTPLLIAALSNKSLPLREVLRAYSSPPSACGWFVGPEGDFTAAELDKLDKHAGIFVSLGANVLRAETACLYGLSVLSCAWL